MEGPLRDRRWWSTRPDRASSSTSWIEDKLRAAGERAPCAAVAGRKRPPSPFPTHRIQKQKRARSPGDQNRASSPVDQKGSPRISPSVEEWSPPEIEEEQEDPSSFFAGSSVIPLPPDPSELPIPYDLILPRSPFHRYFQYLHVRLQKPLIDTASSEITLEKVKTWYHYMIRFVTVITFCHKWKLF